ncbi:vacuolar sorting protein 9 domain-containing protein [Cryptosporidium muris RN66]|uniref:Vacuolar sorting protein 9 domain-containing protein n=1 Tax=Cryptosporidium muris (strain RN66) TaxID=441375 RepID=B6AB26_CRYMR|nr:vacuolar sorting protein 9 domain-containing protein [Cryptosporidium muris RN66]EEA05578.1 vacuolar sorting protein 9 domain-containing protein [Cryptosporidium muris RN66]|eukprot:XP_002139927.1 vacuolar sorting protein 9 domain-containing protein [Cryptosporidium muris RN66]
MDNYDNTDKVLNVEGVIKKTLDDINIQDNNKIFEKLASQQYTDEIHLNNKNEEVGDEYYKDCDNNINNEIILPKETYSKIQVQEDLSIPPGKPLTAYNQFLASLKDPSCSEVVHLIAKFIQKYPELDSDLIHIIYENNEDDEIIKNLGLDEEINLQLLSDILNKFVLVCNNLLLQTEIYMKNDSEEEKNYIIEGLEKLITSKLYNKLIKIISLENKAIDEYLSIKLKKLKSFVQLNHFDVSEIYMDVLNTENSWLDLCNNELYKFVRVKSPRDKVILIVNVCKVLLSYMNNIINEWKDKQNDNNNFYKDIPAPPAADDLLPLLIYSLIQINPPNLKTHLEYTNHFRNPNLLISEDLYFYTHFYSAVTFLEKLDGKQIQLNIDPHIFEINYFSNTEEYIEKSDQVKEVITKKNNLINNNSYRKNSNFHQDIDNIIKKLVLFPLQYEEILDVSDLKMGDIPNLFNQYRDLSKLLNELKTIYNNIH